MFSFHKFFVSLLILLLLTSCGQKTKISKQSFFRMDTIIDVTICGDNNIKKDKLWQTVDSVLKNYEDRFSVASNSSEVKHINERQHDTVTVSRQLGEMVKYAIDYGDSLNGGFDLTILPLKEIWGLSENSPENAPAPTTRQIDSALSLVNYTRVKVSNNFDTLFFSSPGVKIDVGGIAKAFALKSIENVLKQFEVTSYLINGGGDILGAGKKPDGSSWVIGIQNPRKTDVVLATFNFEGGSVFTSGDYERFRIINGKRVHHIFNSHTGYSCTGNQSVTIYGPNAFQNKFLSTGLFCRTADSIVAYVNKRPALKCLVVDSTGKVFISNSWKKQIILQ